MDWNAAVSDVVNRCIQNTALRPSHLIVSKGFMLLIRKEIVEHNIPTYECPPPALPSTWDGFLHGVPFRLSQSDEVWVAAFERSE
jgi:hypothetical protein